MFTQKISMDCTKEQYEKYLKEELMKMGYIETSCSQWHKRENEYITNCYLGLGNVGNINEADIYNIVNDKLTYLGKFNAPLFLALAAMTDNFEGGYREYYVKDNEFYSMKESGFLGANGLFRKATVSEIMAKFGEPKAASITIAIDITNHSDEKRCYYGSEKQMISLLKSKGYKIFKQTTTLEEV